MNETPAAEDSPYLTVPQLARRLHMTPNAIYTARSRRRHFPRGFRRGNKVLFPLAEVEAYEHESQQADSRFNRELDPTRVPAQSRGRRAA